MILIAELLQRLVDRIRTTFFVEEITRKDFLSPDYHQYLNWIEDWSKPMFHYLPIAIRHFNLANPIAPVENNELGFRCGSFTEPDPDELRIVLVGGSAAWGCGASSNEATIAGQLEEICNADRRLLNGKRKARVFNLAQVDSHQTQDLITLLLYAPILKPEIVISFTGWNEVACNSTMLRNYLEDYRVFYLTELEGWQPTKAGNNARKSALAAFSILLEKHSALARAIKRRRPAASNTAQRSVEDSVALSRSLFVENLVRLEALGRAFGFRHVQFLQPYLYRKKHLSESEQKVVELYDIVRPIQGGVATGDYLRANNIYVDIMADAAADSTVGKVYDLCDLFRDEKETTFFSLVHFRDAGYAKLAQAMYENLLDAHAAQPQGSA